MLIEIFVILSLNMKRASEGDQGGSESKKMATGQSGGGLKGMPGNSDDKKDPIPRPLKLQEVTLHFTQRSWEEIGAGELKYLPLSQTPYYMFDDAMLAQLKKFKGLWTTAYYHQPKARLTNLIMLQDDLINQGGTPLETTAFTQACYMLTYQPTRQLQYFALANITDCHKGTYNLLKYNMAQTRCGDDYSYLVKVDNYEDFEKLAILPAAVDQFAGYNPASEIQIGGTTAAYVPATFISPNSTNGDLRNYSANLQPYNNNYFPSAPLIEPLKQVTWARNLDKIALHKYGDTIELPIHTNLEGIPLLNTPLNDFTTRNAKISDKSNNYTFNTEFVWPSTNRPYYSRYDNLSNISAYENAKSLSPIKHTFLTMPPIRKANGALLKQRCSFILEQSFSVTFKTVESIWDDDSDKHVLNQRDGVIVRPMIYGNMASPSMDEGAICPSDEYKCKGSNCPYDNSFASLIEIFVEYMDMVFYKPQGTKEDPTKYKYTTIRNGYFDNADINGSTFKTAWKTFITTIFAKENYDKEFIFQINIQGNPQKVDLTTRNKVRKYKFYQEGAQNYWLNINSITLRQIYADIGIDCGTSDAPSVCNQKLFTDFNAVDRETYMFYM